jgi:Peptidase family M28
MEKMERTGKLNRDFNLGSMKNSFLLLVSISLLVFASCGDPVKPIPNDDSTDVVVSRPRVKGPTFNADSAYNHIQNQVAFGPRVPGTVAHDSCLNYIIRHLKKCGLDPKTQGSTVMFYKKLSPMVNIMAQYKPELTDRILLMAHWDSRPVADEDTVNVDQPIDGADDGASGVAALLEMARIIQLKDPNIGVDFLFVDAEDGGVNNGPAESWCLGSQYWAQHLLPAGYHARYGILLDMVAGKEAVFPREGTSVYYAGDIVQKVWSAAAGLGYGNKFINDVTGETTDDHLFVNSMAGIPTIDIVHYNMNTRSYPAWHHRHSDNMEIIDRSTIQMVGNVLVDVIWNEIPVVE